MSASTGLFTVLVQNPISNLFALLSFNNNSSNNEEGHHAMLMLSFLWIVVVLILAVVMANNSQSSSEAFRPWILSKLKTPSSLSLSSASASSSSSNNNNNNKNNNSNGNSKTSLESSLQWWEDLAPPFAFPTSERGTQEPRLQDLRPHEAVDVVHFCFLVHGYRGYSRDLSYLQTVMQRVADTELKRRVTQDVLAATAAADDDDESNHGSNNDTTNGRQQSNPLLENSSSDLSSAASSVFSSSLQQDVVVYAPTCNERRTDDGVVSGGDRLVQEIRQVIHDEMKQRQKASISLDDDADVDELPRITISMLGNSLGGLYSRYAIAKLLEQCELVEDETNDDDDDDDSNQPRVPTWILDGKYRLSLNIFCTTATPHLGVAGHTFLPIPRTAEVGFAQVMRSTGRDLFRCNDLLRRMATTPEFLLPLGHFRQRIAYANAYGTDFPVPCQTAGFLNEESSSPHYFYDEDDADDEDDEPADAAEAEGLIIAKVYTPRKIDFSSGAATPLRTANSSNDLLDSDQEMDETNAWAVELDKEDELKIMSQTLDSLGWKKVFVDARKNMPKIPLFGLSSSRSSNSSSMEDESSSGADDENDVGDDRQARSESIARLKLKGVVASKDLASAVTAPLFDENFHWPVGHNMIVAFSRSRLSTYLNKAGRPVVDSIAKNLVKEILEWPVTETAKESKPKVAA